MKKFIINNIMIYIKKETNYDEIKLKEIEYGLVSIYLTISKFIVITILSILLGIFKEMIIFMFLFSIIRSTAFGLHASKSWICLISSIIMFLGFPIISIYAHINIYFKIIVLFPCILFIYKNSPADTQKKPIINKKKREIYKIISTIFAIVFSCLAIIIKNQFISNCLIFSLVLENLLISPFVYKVFNVPYNNYITYLEKHPELVQ